MDTKTTGSQRWRKIGLAAALSGAATLFAPIGNQPVDAAPSTRSGSTGLGIELVQKPGAPKLETRDGSRQLSKGEIGGLVAQRKPVVTQCVVDFNDPVAKSVLPDGGKNTFIPWWSQGCGGYGVRAFPLEYGHFHLGYVDPEVHPCLNLSNPHGTPGGEYARGEDCEPIDPVAEERSFVDGHDTWQRIRLDAAGDLFSVSQIRIKSAGARVCYRKPAALGDPWYAAEASMGDGPGQSYCWDNLTPGLWDLSDWVFGINALTLKTAPGYGNPTGLDDVKIA